MRWDVWSTLETKRGSESSGLTRTRNSLGEESNGNRRARATHEDLARGDTPLSKVGRAPKFLNVGDILAHSLRGVVEVESLRPSGVSRTARREQSRAGGASDEAEPSNDGAPRAAGHAQNEVRQSLHTGVHVRVNEPRGTTSPDLELKTAEGDGDREIAVVEGGFDFR